MIDIYDIGVLYDFILYTECLMCSKYKIATLARVWKIRIFRQKRHVSVREGSEKQKDNGEAMRWVGNMAINIKCVRTGRQSGVSVAGH